jgi:hypothetical protein
MNSIEQVGGNYVTTFFIGIPADTNAHIINELKVQIKGLLGDVNVHMFNKGSDDALKRVQSKVSQINSKLPKGSMFWGPGTKIFDKVPKFNSTEYKELSDTSAPYNNLEQKQIISFLNQYFIRMLRERVPNIENYSADTIKQHISEHVSTSIDSITTNETERNKLKQLLSSSSDTNANYDQLLNSVYKIATLAFSSDYKLWGHQGKLDLKSNKLKTTEIGQLLGLSLLKHLRVFRIAFNKQNIIEISIPGGSVSTNVTNPLVNGGGAEAEVAFGLMSCLAVIVQLVFQEKYLKYKQKYLELKKLLN